MKKPLNKGVIINTIKQLFYPAILFFIIGVLLIIIPGISEIINDSRDYYKAALVYNIADVSLKVTMILGSFLLSFTALGFCWNRKRTDLEYSLPVNKGQLYLSKLIGVIIIQTSVLLMLFIISFCCSINYLGSFTFFADILYSLASAFTGSLVIIGAVFIAMSVTGKPISSALLSVGILVYPVILTYNHLFFDHRLQYYDILDVIKPPLYVLTNEIFSLGNGLNFKGYMPSLIFSFVLSIVYFTLGYFLFRQRSGEVSEKHTKNKFVHYIVMSFAALPVMYYSVLQYKNFTYNFSRLNWKNMSAMIFFLIIGLIIIFVYELAVNRKIRRKNRCIWVFLVLCIITFLADSIIEVYTKSKYQEKIDVSEVQSISTVPCSYYIDFFNNYRDLTYAEYSAGKFEITDKSIIDEAVENYNTKYVLSNEQAVCKQTVGFNLKSGKTIYKNVSFATNTEVENSTIIYNNNIYTSILNIAEYKDKYYAAMPLEYVTYVSCNDDRIDKENESQLMEIYEIFLDEYNSLTADEKLFMTSQSSMRRMASIVIRTETEADAFGLLYVKGRAGTTNILDTYLITELTPDALNKYKELVEEKEKEG